MIPYSTNVISALWKLDQAMHYHIDIKHNTYWDIEEEARTNLYTQRERQGHPQKKKEETSVKSPDEQDIVVKVKEESEDITDTMAYNCEFGEKSFLTENGIRVQESKMHKEEWRNKDKISHNKDFHLERKDSLTRSPPAKKTKDKSTDIIDVRPHPMDKDKDEVILKLRVHVKKLQAQLQEVNDVKIQFLNKTPTTKPPEAVEANANIINLIGVEEVSSRSFKCDNCEEVIDIKGKLLGHKCQKETVKEPYKWQFKMDGHQLPNEEIYEINSCEKCQQVFKTKSQLGDHMDVRHMDIETQGPNLIKFQCENCKREFPNRNQ